MREKTKVIMLITAAAFVGLMIFEWGMDASGQAVGQVRPGEVGRVNGSPISTQAFSETLRNVQQRITAERREPISAAEDRAIEDDVWRRLVTDVLIEQELARRGIRTTNEEIRQAARFMPPPELIQNEMFHTDGQFDLERYHAFLASPAAGELLYSLEAYYLDVIPRNKLMNQVVAGIHVTDGELWRLWRDQNERVAARFIAIDPQRVIADTEVSVSDREMQTHYRDNREEYRRPASASVQFVRIDRRPTAADTAAVRERALELHAEILGGASFAEVAERESADPGSAARGGDLGRVFRGQTTQAFDEAVFTLPIGELSEPVRTEFGFHLIQVQSRTEDEAEVRHILLPFERSPESEDRLLALADSLDRLGETTQLDAAARQLGLEVRTAEIFEPAPYLSGIGPVDDGGRWLFREAEPGESSPLFDADDAFYMLKAERITPSYVPPLEEVSDAIRMKLMAVKKRDRARDVARQIVDEIRGGQSMDAVAEARGLEVGEAGPFHRFDFVPGMGIANAAIGAAFGLEPGAISDAVEADGSYFVIQTVDRTPADRDAWEAQKEQQRARVLSRMEQERWELFIDALWDRAKIEDNREEVLRGPPEDLEERRRLPGLF